MKPITRKEYYLAKAAGTYTGPTPPPVLREDYYLATLAGDYSGHCPAPVTRIEKYMSAAAGLTSYVPQPVTRIEKYWYAIAKGTGYVPEPVTREEKFLYAVLKNPPKPEYLDKTAEGSTILLTDSAQAPLTALTVYGKSTQDGTPSPDNPVPIVSAGSVMTTGAQLIDTSLIPPYDKWDGEFGGIYLKDERTWFLKIPNNNSVAKVWNEDFTKALTWGELMPTLSVGDIITFGQNVDLNETINIAYNSASGLVVHQGDSITVTQNFLDSLAQFYGVDGAGTTCERVEIQINRGTIALPWEPYTGGQPAANPYEGEIDVTISDGGTQSQTLTLSTPGGLPGIPVSSGGNYTDENGQQWICDEVDFKRGKYVQRVAIEQKNGNFQMTGSADFSGRYHQYGVLDAIFKNGLYESFCNIASWALWGIGNTHTSTNWVFALNSNGFYISPPSESGIESAEELNNLLNSLEFPVVFVGQLETPIETDLPAEEIAAYKALHTYSPTTTVTNDADAWMKVGYKAIP